MSRPPALGHVREKGDIRAIDVLPLTYAFIPSPGAIPMGKFAISPIAADARADMAAVVVISSWRTSSTQVR